MWSLICSKHLNQLGFIIRGFVWQKWYKLTGFTSIHATLILQALLRTLSQPANIINSNIITSGKGEYTNEAVGLPKSIYYVINWLCSKKLVLQYTSGVHTFRTSSLAHNNSWSCAFFKGLFLFVTCLSLECSFGFVANNDVKMTVNIRKICSLRSQFLSLNKWAANSCLWP